MEESLTDKELRNIAENEISVSNWKKVGLRLGRPWRKICEFESSYEYMEGVFLMLLFWHRECEEPNRKQQLKEAIRYANDVDDNVDMPDVTKAISNDLLLYNLAERIGIFYKDVGASLGIRFARLQNLEYDFGKASIVDAAMEMLHQWRNSKGGQDLDKDDLQKLQDCVHNVLDIDAKNEIDVFISYAICHRKIFREISTELKKANSELIINHFEHPVEDHGTPKSRATSTAISKSRKIILLISTQCLATKHFTEVFLEAWQKERSSSIVTLIPVLVGDVKPEELPSQVEALRALRHGEEQFYDKLTDAINSVEPATRILPAGDVGTGLAWSYYFGYLRLKLPTFDDQLNRALKITQENQLVTADSWTWASYLPSFWPFNWFRRSSNLSQSFQAKKHSNVKIFNKFVILLPQSCSFPGGKVMEDFEGIDKLADIPFFVDRAGIQKRNYSSKMFYISHSSHQKPSRVQGEPVVYGVAVEFATPMLSLWEMHQTTKPKDDGDAPKISFTEHDLKWQTQRFLVKLSEILAMDNTCENKFLCINYDDSEEHRDPSSTALADTIYNWVDNVLT